MGGGNNAIRNAELAKVLARGLNPRGPCTTRACHGGACCRNKHCGDGEKMDESGAFNGGLHRAMAAIAIAVKCGEVETEGGLGERGFCGFD